MVALRIVDVVDEPGLLAIPPCADSRFDHRTCDYWEDADRGSKSSRPSMLAAVAPVMRPRPALEDNPFAPRAKAIPENPFMPASRAAALGGFASDDEDDADDRDGADWNPFVPTTTRERPLTAGVPRKLALLDRGRGVFGSYAKVAYRGESAVAYAQFGPLSAYPRASRLRELYPQLPDSPLPAVITCVATTDDARRTGVARDLILAVCRDLAGRGFAAVEAYPDLTRSEDEQSGGRPAFWERCGFTVAVADERFPVMRREL